MDINLLAIVLSFKIPLYFNDYLPSYQSCVHSRSTRYLSLEKDHYKNMGCLNGYRIYVDIMTEENCRQFRLLTWNLLYLPLCPFNRRRYMGGIVILASYEFHFIGEHENLV